jgi:GNAT superfamily N-acetyltransferase
VPRLDGDRWSCRITDIVVSPSHRRSGVGSDLVAAAQDEAHRAGAPRLDLSSGEWRADAPPFTPVSASRRGLAASPGASRSGADGKGVVRGASVRAHAGTLRSAAVA